MDRMFEQRCKLLMLGDTCVGKTCMLNVFDGKEFKYAVNNTVGVDFKTKSIKIKPDDPYSVKLQIWDTAGQERYRTITSSYYRGAHGIMLVYDVTDRTTFKNVENWMLQIMKHADANVCTILVGNKIDLDDQRQISTMEGALFAAKCRVPFFETSAKTGASINDAFTALSAAVMAQRLREGGVGADMPGGIRLQANNNVGAACC